MSEKLLEVKNLKTSFFIESGEVEAVRGVTFRLHKGEVVGIVGESGSGKKCNGEVCYVSRYVTRKSERRGNPFS